MIDLERLVIVAGDIVKRKGISSTGEYVPFIVAKTDIDGNTMRQRVYPSYGPPVYADEVIIVSKNDNNLTIDPNLTTLTEILNTFYKDNWEICEEGHSLLTGFRRRIANSCRKLLVIKYPETTIKNSRNSEHTIRDLFIFIPLTNTYRFALDTNIYGSRSTFTEGELRASYTHSHLSGMYSINYGNINIGSFCTGGDVLDETRVIANNSDPKDNRLGYEIFFETLNSFVAWESLEGGPYRNMTNITETSQLVTGNAYSDPFGSNMARYSELIQYLKNNNFEIPFTVNLNVESYLGTKECLLIDRDELDKRLADFIIDNHSDILSSNINFIRTTTILTDGNRPGAKCYSFRRVISSLDTVNENEDKNNEFEVSSETATSYVFKGENIKYKVLKLKDSEVSRNHIHINAYVLDKLILMFKANFYGNLWRREEEFIQQLTESGS